MSDPTRPVRCDLHGETPATFVCQHLAFGLSCGFHASEQDPDDPWPDAWCACCDQVWDHEGAFNEVVQAQVDLKLLCTHCYEAARARNLAVPAHLEGVGVLDEDGRRSFVSACCADAQRAQAAATQRLDLEGYARWDYEGATFELSDPQKGRLRGRLAFVGSWSRDDESWLWSWANGTIAPEERRDIELLRGFGRARRLERLVEPRWQATEEDAWHMTYVAAALLRPDLVFRVPADDLVLFLLLFDLEPVD